MAGAPSTEPKTATRLTAERLILNTRALQGSHAAGHIVGCDGELHACGAHGIQRHAAASGGSSRLPWAVSVLSTSRNERAE